MIVYAINNRINGKVYIGQTICPVSKRWREHQLAAKKGHLFPLYKAMRKYGLNAFECIEVGNAENSEHLNDMEKAIIDLFDATNRAKGYNLTTGGKGHACKHSLITRKKLSLSRIGRKFGHHSEETRRKMSLALLGNKRALGNKNSLGRHWSEEDRKRMSEQRRGENNGNFGRKHSEETKQKCREAALKQAQERRASRGETYV